MGGGVFGFSGVVIPDLGSSKALPISIVHSFKSVKSKGGGLAFLDFWSGLLGL